MKTRPSAGRHTFTVITQVAAVHPRVAWIIANTIGWSVALLAASVILQVIGGVMGVLLAGATAGGISGGIQVRTQPYPLIGSSRTWILLSIGGGLLGGMMLFPALVGLILGRRFGFALMGMVFGLCYGGIQSIALRESLPGGSGLWIIANLLGGGLCATLTLGGVPGGLPVICSPGPLLFALCTGAVFLAAANMEP